MTKRRFEEEWKSAFDGAEVEPSENVWTGVELDLEKGSGVAARRQLTVYRWLAAASVLVAVGVSALYFLSDNRQAEPVTAQALHGNESLTDNPQPVADATATVDKPSNEALQPSPQSKRFTERSQRELPLGLTDRKATTAVLTDQPEQIFNSLEREVRNRLAPARQMPVLYSFKNPELNFSKQEPVADPGALLLAKLADEERAYAKAGKKKGNDEHLWTSVGFGAGSFNPNAGSSANASTFNTTGNSSAGMSYSVGAAIGGRVGSRFVLQGGVSYLQQNASYTSSLLSMETATAAASLDDYIDRQANLVATTPYEVASNLQYVTLPLQAGYLILDHDFAIQLNGGVATDFFIQNTLTPDNPAVASVTQKAGEDSPYRTVNFSGIVGTELSYKFAGRYRIAVNPGIRYAFNSIYKPEISREITPITYDVALRFRYIFN